MTTVFCMIEQITPEIEAIIESYDDSYVMELYTDVVESSDRNLLYCIGELATGIFNTDNDVWLITDNKDINTIASKYYGVFISNIQLISSNNSKSFSKEFDISGLIDYEASIVFDNNEKALLGGIISLIDNKDYATLYKNNFFLGEFYLNYKNTDKDKYWYHFCLLILDLIKNKPLRTDRERELLILSIYHFMMILAKTPEETNKFLKYYLKQNYLDEYEIFYIWNQIKALSLRKYIETNDISAKLLDELYSNAYSEMKSKLNDLIQCYSCSDRNNDRVIVMTIQMLSGNHAPTKSVTERCAALVDIGKEVMLVNTREQYTNKSELPLTISISGKVINEYSDINSIDVGDGRKIKFYQPSVPMPDKDEIKKIFDIIKEFKPAYILSIGNGSIIADLCSEIVPVFPMALAFSTLPTSKCQHKIIGRTLNESEKNLMPNVIESRFTFRLNPQKKVLYRSSFNIPENAFALVVVGIRLDYEITEEFINMLERVLSEDCHVVFAGYFEKYEEWCNKFDKLKKYSHFIGYCDDILALMEIIDLYVNPDRLGGGFSIIESFSKEKPGVYLNNGDVFVAGGNEFSVSDYNEMATTILKYKSDKVFYRNQAEKALKRSEYMTDSIGAIKELDELIKKLCKFF